ncbi:MAG TPA: M23 family metallopeptidase [Tenericutes bacterium]|nr:M23 family metallopeptidase [Mycoplasmatota bacterium]
MKQNLTKISIIIIFIVISLFVFTNKIKKEPNIFYQVYLDGELLGTIKSVNKLMKYIDKKGEYIKNKYRTDHIYSPQGLKITKIFTYKNKLSSEKTIYNKITDNSSFTVKGYQFTIKNENRNIVINVLDKQVFEEAINKVIETFVGKNEYNKYLKETQDKIETTGKIIENIYIDENITIKEKYIPTNDKIYMNPEDIVRFLIFGNEKKESTYEVKIGDTIKSISFDNQISTEEFLLSNETIKSENNLLYPGQIVTIAQTDPQISVVTEEFVVEDRTYNYTTLERIDENKLKGYKEVIQKGENGIERVAENVKKINGTTVYVEGYSNTELKPMINQIIVIGGKVVSNIGSLTSWGWPTLSGWVITSDYEWRINPVTFKRELHSGIDISGLGYGSPVFAANNGTIIKKQYAYDYGNYVVIDHNNGYYTVYAHLSKFNNELSVGSTVSRGNVLGYIGSTGYATGPHLHYEIWKNCHYCRINPWSVY